MLHVAVVPNGRWLEVDEKAILVSCRRSRWLKRVGWGMFARMEMLKATKDCLAGSHNGLGNPQADGLMAHSIAATGRGKF